MPRSTFSWARSSQSRPSLSKARRLDPQAHDLPDLVSYGWLVAESAEQLGKGQAAAIRPDCQAQHPRRRKWFAGSTATPSRRPREQSAYSGSTPQRWAAAAPRTPPGSPNAPHPRGPWCAWATPGQSSTGTGRTGSCATWWRSPARLMSPPSRSARGPRPVTTPSMATSGTPSSRSTGALIATTRTTAAAVLPRLADPPQPRHRPRTRDRNAQTCRSPRRTRTSIAGTSLAGTSRSGSRVPTTTASTKYGGAVRAGCPVPLVRLRVLDALAGHDQDPNRMTTPSAGGFPGGVGLQSVSTLTTSSGPSAPIKPHPTS